MRILHITNYLPHSHRIWGGAEVACRNVVDLLVSTDGISCAVAATPPQSEVIGDFAFFPVETISDRYPAPYFFYLRHFWLSKDGEVERQLANVLDVYRPDIVHFHNFNVLTFSALDAVKKAGLPAVLSVYDYWLFCPSNMLLDLNNRICSDGHGFHCLSRCLHAQFSRRSNFVSNLPIFTRPRYFARKLAQFDRIIALSANSRDVIRRYGPSNLEIDVIPLPIKIQDRTEGLPEFEQPTVLFAGWVQARKGPDVIVRAMQQVVRAIPQARLLVVGPLSESKFEAYIRKLVADLSLQDAVTFTGKLSSEEFDRVFAGAHVVAIAEQWENMSPVFALECMAAQKPIVSGAIGGIPEFIRNGEDGLLVQYDDPTSYAEAIIRLLRNRDFARRLSFNAAIHAKSLCDRRSVIERLLKVYGSALDTMEVRQSA
jgi:glycosyltransferase involved in cell wall biosynthesis